MSKPKKIKLGDKGDKPACKYGSKCFRKNAGIFLQMCYTFVIFFVFFSVAMFEQKNI